jgi:ABC-type uncharacterized transport system involved in gliding motility auxiliary subunit
MQNKVLSIISYIGMALVFGAVAVRLLGWTGRVTITPEVDRYALYAVWTGFALVLAYTVVQIATSRRRDVRYGAIASLSVLVLAGILIAVNYLSNTRFNKRVDLTANSVNSLAEQSEKVLTSLDSPLKMILFDQSINFDRYRERLTQYDYASDRVQVEYVDGDKDPVRTKQYEIQSYPTVVVEYKGRTEKVTALEERDLTGAVIRAVTGQQRKVYFVQGHGEKDPNGMDGPGYAGVVQLLKGDNVAVEPLVLTQHKDVPDDATVVTVVGPTTEMLDEELESLKRYLGKGGRLLLMVDPTIGERDQQLPKLAALAKDWGVDIGNDVILDVSGRSPNATFPVTAPPYPSHPITDGFRVSLVFPLSRSITPVSPAPEGKTVDKLIETAAAAWAETNIAQLKTGGQPQFDPEGGDRQGPVGIAAVVTTPSPPQPDPADKNAKPSPPQTRIAVFGDSDFGSNAYAGSLGNADFFVNTINWLSAQENLIAIRPRQAGDSRLTITPQQMNMVWWFSVLVVPAVVLGAGVFTWTRRRRA